MTSDELKLKELAVAATQGEWRFARGEDDGIHVVHSHVWGPKTHIGGSSSTDVDADREYIAAANPTAILSLLTRIEALEQDAARYRWLRNQAPETIDDLGRLKTVDEFDAAIDALIAQQDKGKETV